MAQYKNYNLNTAISDLSRRIEMLEPLDYDIEYSFDEIELDVVLDDDCDYEEHNETKETIKEYLGWVTNSSTLSQLHTNSHLKTLFMQINELSCKIFEVNKSYGADSINIFSPKILFILDLFNIATSEIKFSTKLQYDDKEQFLVGRLYDRYNVYLPKEITRTVLTEKNKEDIKSEKFIKTKHNIIEVFNSKDPNKKFAIKLEEIQ